MKELICISCPRGCHLEIREQGDSWQITGNSCPRGIAYARQEVSDPRRIVTAVVPCKNPEHPFVAVRTDLPCPKAMIPGLLNRLYRTEVKKSIKNGDIVLKNVDNSGISVIVTENI
ncbi:MAG: DUF1667 domain-containing protein [Lentisphaerae bacterium]|nr:DUF1667 domain-containing protein [Lentisphaerota bacterium]